jgi:DNA polymerase III subunit epsilon
VLGGLASAPSNGQETAWRPAAAARPLPPRITEAEAAAHRAFVEKLGPDALWAKAGAGQLTG